MGGPFDTFVIKPDEVVVKYGLRVADLLLKAGADPNLFIAEEREDMEYKMDLERPIKRCVDHTHPRSGDMLRVLLHHGADPKLCHDILGYARSMFDENMDSMVIHLLEKALGEEPTIWNEPSNDGH